MIRRPPHPVGKDLPVPLVPLVLPVSTTPDPTSDPTADPTRR
jgi:hypothetical protein